MKTALAAASVMALLLGSAHSREIQVGSGLVCNTAKQVEKFVAFSDADPRAAINATNDEENDPKACAVVNIAFVRGHNTVTVRTRHATFQIADILVVGVIINGGIQFSLFQVDERKA